MVFGLAESSNHDLEIVISNHGYFKKLRAKYPPNICPSIYADGRFLKSVDFGFAHCPFFHSAIVG